MAWGQVGRGAHEVPVRFDQAHNVGSGWGCGAFLGVGAASGAKLSIVEVGLSVNASA